MILHVSPIHLDPAVEGVPTVLLCERIFEVVRLSGEWSPSFSSVAMRDVSRSLSFLGFVGCRIPFYLDSTPRFPSSFVSPLILNSLLSKHHDNLENISSLLFSKALVLFTSVLLHLF